LTSALLGDEWLGLRPGRFTCDERTPDTYWIEGWVDPRAGLEAVVGESNSGRPVRSLAVSSISDSRKTRSVTFSVDLQYQASWKSMKRANGKYGVSIMHFYAFRTKDAHKKLNLFILIQPE
jgi:hypothetical protein